MARKRTLLRGVGLAAFVGYAAATAFLLLNWSSISPQAASERVDALIDSGHTDDEVFHNAIAGIRRFNPSIATYAEGVAAESSQSATATSEAALDLAESKYLAAAQIAGPAQANAMVRLARLQLRRGEANRDPARTVDLLERAYALGSSRAGFELGQLHLSGDFVPRDRNKAIAYFKDVSGGVPEASLALAQLYRDGAAIPPSQATAIDLGARAMWQFEERIRQTGAAKYMLALANAYDGAIAGGSDYAKAGYWFERAAADGNREALAALAKFYAKPGTGLQDLARARAIYEQLAESGNLSATVKTADFKRQGIGGPVDLAGAAHLYERAATQGSSAAEFRYAIALRDGEGVDVNPARSFELLERSANSGNIGAAVELGRAYENGVHVAADPAKALEWYKAAASRGSLKATVLVALAYARGALVQANQKEYVAWGMRAIERGADLPRLQSSVGAALIAGTDLPQDRTRGFQLLLSAANGGRAEAILAVARCYAFGIGVKQDAGKAVEWYERAASRGRVAAYWELGRAYASGFGVPMDENLAYEYFVKAASGGYAAAMVDLGRMYITGFGAARDPERGAAWLTKAADLGNANAMIEMANVHRERLVPGSSDAEVLHWLQRGAETGSARAEYVLALNYLSGSIVERDAKKAEALLASAASKHNAPAKTRLKLLREQQQMDTQ